MELFTERHFSFKVFFTFTLKVASCNPGILVWRGPDNRAKAREIVIVFSSLYSLFIVLSLECPFNYKEYIRVKRKHIDNELLVLFCLWLIEQWQAEIKLLNLTVLSDYCSKDIRDRILMIELCTRSDSTITRGYLTKPDHSYIFLASKCPTKLRNRHKVLWKTNLLVWEVSSE